MEAGIREFAPTAEIHFERVAVNPDQIREMNLPTRPTKKSDSRSKTFVGESVEVDAIDPRELRRMTTECILRHVDHNERARLRRVELAERQTLENIAEHMSEIDFE